MLSQSHMQTHVGVFPPAATAAVVVVRTQRQRVSTAHMNTNIIVHDDAAADDDGRGDETFSVRLVNQQCRPFRVVRRSDKTTIISDLM